MLTLQGTRLWIFLLFLTLVTAGGSIWYLTDVANRSDTRAAKGYPAPWTSVAADNVVLTQNLALGRGFTLATTTPFTPDTWRTPGYPAFVYPFYRLFGDFYPVLYVQIVLVFFTVLLVYYMARSVVGPAWALGISVVYLLLPDTMLAASALTTETLFTFVFTSALYICFFSRFKGTFGGLAATGVLLALATYIRPSGLYILFFFIPAYLFIYLKRSELTRKTFLGVLLLAVAYMGTLLPWYVRNYQETGVFAFASTGPFFLFRQNAVSFYEGLRGIPNLEARYELEDMAGIPRGPVPTGPEYSDAMRRVALEVIFSHPFRYALFHLSTFIPFFTSSGVNDYWVFVNNLGPNFDRPPEPSFIQAVNPFKLDAFITVLKNHGWTLVENALWALVTALVAIGLWRSKDVRMARMLFALILYFAVVTGPGSHARYRMPVDALLLIIAVSTIVFSLERRKSERAEPLATSGAGSGF